VNGGNKVESGNELEGYDMRYINKSQIMWELNQGAHLDIVALVLYTLVVDGDERWVVSWDSKVLFRQILIKTLIWSD
jgi:hypothetical protein